MKKLVTCIFMFALAMQAEAKKVTIEVNEGLIYDSIESSFDGSVLIVNPRVWVGGQYLEVSRGSNVCALLGKQTVQAWHERFTSGTKKNGLYYKYTAYFLQADKLEEVQYEFEYIASTICH